MSPLRFPCPQARQGRGPLHPPARTHDLHVLPSHPTIPVRSAMKKPCPAPRSSTGQRLFPIKSVPVESVALARRPPPKCTMLYEMLATEAMREVDLEVKDRHK